MKSSKRNYTQKSILIINRRGFTEDQIGAALANYQREAGETAEGALERMETEKDADVVLLTDLVILVLVCGFGYKAGLNSALQMGICEGRGPEGEGREEARGGGGGAQWARGKRGGVPLAAGARGQN